MLVPILRRMMAIAMDDRHCQDMERFLFHAVSPLPDGSYKIQYTVTHRARTKTVPDADSLIMGTIYLRQQGGYYPRRCFLA